MRIRVKHNVTAKRTNKLFGTGIYAVDQKTAEDLIDQGAAIALRGNEGKEVDQDFSTPAQDKLSEELPGLEGIDETSRDVQSIPEDFPERQLLVDNGFNSIEDLQAPDAQDRISNIGDMTKARLTKIGTAIGKL